MNYPNIGLNCQYKTKIVKKVFLIYNFLMKEQQQPENKIKFFAEFLNNTAAEQIHFTNYKKIIIPYNSRYSLCLFVPEKGKQNVLPFFMEDVLKNIPLPIIIFNKDFSLVSTNITETEFLKEIRKKIEKLRKENMERLYLFETLSDILFHKGKEYKLYLTPLIKDKNNFGYICTAKHKESTVKQSLSLLNKTAAEILSSERKETPIDIFNRIKKILKLENLYFFKKGKNSLTLIFPFNILKKEEFTLPKKVRESLRENPFNLVHRDLFPIKQLKPLLKKHTFLYSHHLPGQTPFAVIGSSEERIDLQTLKNSEWLLKVFFISLTQSEKDTDIDNIFENYKQPSILVEKQTLKIIYANRSFKRYFGENEHFFNALLSTESNLNILTKLDMNNEPFTEHIDTITKNNLSAEAKITVIPAIENKGKELFAVIFKIGKDQNNTQLNLERTQKKSLAFLEKTLILSGKHLTLISGEKDTEEITNLLLKDISQSLKAEIGFIAKIENKGKVILLNSYKEKNNADFENILKKIKKEREIFKEKPGTIIENKHISGTGSLLLIKFMPDKTVTYILGLGFQKERKLKGEESIAISTFLNILTLAFKRKEEKNAIIKAEKENERLKKINREIISSISHEIKTPLTSIIGLSEILTEKTKGENREFITHINTNALKLLDLLETMLNINKIKEKETYIEKKHNVNTNEFLENIQSFVKGLNKSPSVKFRIVSKNMPSYFIQDGTIIYRIIINLLDNAFRHTKRGIVTLSLSYEKKYFVIEIKDTGEGIKKENLNKIFSPFFREKNHNTAKKGNVGLGLYIVKQLCDIIKADIIVTSTKNKGTYFKISIPIQGEK